MADANTTRGKSRQGLPWKFVGALKRFYYRFLKIRGTPQQISCGLALGVFIGMTPFLGFHTAIAVMLASLFKWNKITAGLGVFVTNPLTAPLVYPLTLQLGAAVTGFSEPIRWLKLLEQGGFVDMMKNSPWILVDMLIGGAIVGVPLALVVYFVALRWVLSARKRMQQRKARRKQIKGSVKKKDGLR
jgi:uncharacterized protein (DUF2062 family)